MEIYDFILQNLLIISAGAIVFLFVRALPRVSGEASGGDAPWSARLESWFNRLPLTKIDDALLSFVGKILRQLRVVNLKIENFINFCLSKLRKNPDKAEEAEARKKDELFR